MDEEEGGREEGGRGDEGEKGGEVRDGVREEGMRIGVREEGFILQCGAVCFTLLGFCYLCDRRARRELDFLMSGRFLFFFGVT